MNTNPTFTNRLVNKRELKYLIYNAFLNYGLVASTNIVDRIKNLTFHYATKSGISISIEDLRIPYTKRELIGLTTDEVQITLRKYNVGNITFVERFQKTIDIWNNANNFLKDEVLAYFRESDPLNPLYIMAFSGARGNISQVRQLMGMRGLMSDPQGQIIDLPIKSNFCEGLSVTEYIISSYGARKGLVDTALRTADSGYLTRRLVDVAQDIIVRKEDCYTTEGLLESEILNKEKSDASKLIGRLLANDLLARNNDLIAKANTEITSDHLKKWKRLDCKPMKVRSPLTCQSIRSVCRNCYGWHLSYSKIVDLGEAIGIIAAQSIGEPGTQLTMRTFHTGGVFSGEMTDQLRTPFKGILSYQPNIKAFLFRTLHGETGFQLKEEIRLSIENSKKTRVSFKLSNGSLLLANNGQKVYNKEIIGEIKKDDNLILEEDKKDISSEINGQIYFSKDSIKNSNDSSSANNFISQKESLIWVLQGKMYSFPKINHFITKVGSVLTNHDVLTFGSITNTRSGIVNFSPKSENSSLNILNFSLVVSNLYGSAEDGNNYLTLINGSKTFRFRLDVPINKLLKKCETIATLIDSSYTTETGGIVTYNLEKTQSVQRKKNLKKIFSGKFYWIPEATYHSTKFEAENGEFIKPGQEVMPNNIAKIQGLAQINELDQELVLKPAELLLINKSEKSFSDQSSRFLRPGEFLVKDRVIVQRLAYLECQENYDLSYLIIRPVKTYSIPRVKSFALAQNFFPNISKEYLRIKIVTRIFYKNWERVPSIDGVNLLQTFLSLDLKNTANDFYSRLEFLNYTKSKLKLKISTPPPKLLNLKVSLHEVINLKNHTTKNLGDKLATRIFPLVKDKQYVYQNTTLGYFETFLKERALLTTKTFDSDECKAILVFRNKDLRNICYSSEDKLLVKVGDLVRVGTCLTSKVKSCYSGQVYKLINNEILIRLGKPYLISEGTIVQVQNGTFIKNGGTLATLVYRKLKTADIVQGLPKVEEILEARKIINSCLLSPSQGYIQSINSRHLQLINLQNETIDIQRPIDTNFLNFKIGDFIEVSEPLTEGPISPHVKLNTLFNYYKTVYSVFKACRVSFKYLQLFLVSEIQRTYSSQGVSINDKHIEVIVKQMTSKICIEDSGSTTFLPGEIVNFRKIEALVNTLNINDERMLTYTPILLGITKASLNSDSFISAASFQETTRVLTESAIEGKKDWLNGLKENVIIGRLIPAGTGFSYNENKMMLKREAKELELVFKDGVRKEKSDLLSASNKV